MRHTAVFIACLLCVLVASSSAATILKTGLIVFNNTAIQSNGNPNQVTLVPINVCDPTQLWVWDSDGYIYQKGSPNSVLDVKDENPSNGVPVIMYTKKPGFISNQIWTVNPGNITTKQNGMWLRKSSASNGVVTSSNVPFQNFVFQDPPPCPDTCTSHGDPHFTSWMGSRFDFQSANTVLLALFSGTRVYAVQFSCAPGVTCNEGFVVHPAGTNDTFQLTGTSIAYFNKMQTTVAMGTTVYSSFVNVTRTSNTALIVSIPGATIAYGAYKWQYGYYVNLGITLNARAVLSPSLCVGPAPGQNAHTYGSQFLVPTQNTTAYQYTVTPFAYNPNYVPNYGPYTTNDTALIQQTTAACNQITSTPGLGACNSLVPPDFYVASCYNDSYALKDVSVTQMSIDTYAALCSQAAKANGTNITLPTSSVTTVIVGAVLTLNTGVQTTFTIIAKDVNSVPRTTGGDSFTITSMGPSMLTFTIVDNNNGTYTVTYTTGAEGIYTISVKLSNISDVSNSPVTVNVVAATSAATTSVVLGPVPTNQTSSFTIQARTSTGADRTQGGDTFTVTFIGGSFSLVSIIDNNDGTYTVYYIPYNTGKYTVVVQFQGTGIECSPYTVIVR